jgi:uncharacterized membrane protein
VERDGRPGARWLLRGPGFGGVVVALLFWWWSLYPSMLPRSWPAQAVVSGLSLAVGYLLGTLAGSGVAWVLRRAGRAPAAAVRRRAWLGLGFVGAVVVAAGLLLWPVWQNDQRELVGMGRLSPVAVLPLVVATAVVFGLLLLLGRLVGHGVGLLDAVLARRLPRLLAHGITAAVLVVAAVVASRDVVADGFFSWANDRFARVDATTAPGVVRPTTPASSGSPASLVPWETLGEYGRSFVAGTTSQARLRAFHGPAADVLEPIRAYVGLRSAGSADQRAALAVRELERAGAFRREVLSVVTVTGTGWVDPEPPAPWSTSMVATPRWSACSTRTCRAGSPSSSTGTRRPRRARPCSATSTGGGRSSPPGSAPSWSCSARAWVPTAPRRRSWAPAPRRRSTSSPPRPTACCSPAPPRPTRSGTS